MAHAASAEFSFWGNIFLAEDDGGVAHRVVGGLLKFLLLDFGAGGVGQEAALSGAQFLGGGDGGGGGAGAAGVGVCLGGIDEPVGLEGKSQVNEVAIVGVFGPLQGVGAGALGGEKV